MAGVPASFKLSAGMDEVATSMFNVDTEDETDEDEYEDAFVQDLPTALSSIHCKAAAMDCILALEAMQPAAIWPVALHSFIADAFLACSTTREIDCVREQVNVMVVTASNQRELLDIDWASLPRPSVTLEDDFVASSDGVEEDGVKHRDVIETSMSTSVLLTADDSDAEAAPAPPEPDASAPKDPPSLPPADESSVEGPPTAPTTASEGPAAATAPVDVRKSASVDGTWRKILTDGMPIEERLATLLIQAGYLQAGADALAENDVDEVFRVYTYALQHYFVYNTETGRMDLTEMAPRLSNTYTFAELAKRIRDECSGGATPEGLMAKHEGTVTDNVPRASSSGEGSPHTVGGGSANEGFRECSACGQLLPSDRFTKKQRKKKKGARRCMDCLAEEGSGMAAAAPAAAPSVAAPPPPPPTNGAAPGDEVAPPLQAPAGRDPNNMWCAACGTYKLRSTFSLKQQTRSAKTRRCSLCIKNDIQVAQHESGEETEAVAPEGHLKCSGCAQILPTDNFSKKQRTKGDYRRCRACIDSSNSMAAGAKPVPTPVSYEHMMAESLREEGNVHYRDKDFDRAVSSYSQAIVKMPDNAIYWGNRSAAYYMLGLYAESLKDAQRAIQLDPHAAKYHARAGKNYIHLGSFTRARLELKRALRIEPSLRSAAEGLEALDAAQRVENTARDWLLADEPESSYESIAILIEEMEKAHSTPGLALLLRLADIRSMPFREDRDDTIASVDAVIDECVLDPDAALSFYAGLCLYYVGDITGSLDYFEEGADQDPELHVCRRFLDLAVRLDEADDQGNSLLERAQYTHAQSVFQRALAIDPSNKAMISRLHFNRGMAFSKLGQSDNAMSAFSDAIAIDNRHVEALFHRAKEQFHRKAYQEAVKDSQAAYDYLLGRQSHTHHTRELLRQVKDLLLEGKTLLKKSKRVDFYKLLGISETASSTEINKAYKKACKKHHPDRHRTPEAKAKGEAIFKSIGEAYKVLSDPHKRARYDAGQDSDDSFHDHGENTFHGFHMDDLMAFFFAHQFRNVPDFYDDEHYDECF